ncbi:MAG: histone deacetylase family protein [Planctomycetota bacterium]
MADLPLLELESRDAARAELETAHDPAYLDALKGRIAAGARQLDADTAVGADSFSAAVRAAGAALALAEALLEDGIDSGFACVRPPGHHACHARAMGFCLVNNAAVLARFLQSRGKRVAIVDWDVHHGNGTQDIFWREPEVGYCSLHEFPFYPGTGSADEAGAGNILNIPLRAGCGDIEYQAAFDDRVLPWLDERAPDIVIVSAGFDAHAADPLAGMDLSAESFAAFTRKLLDWPILSLLEGGYDLDGLASSVRAHLQVLVDA